MFACRSPPVRWPWRPAKYVVAMVDYSFREDAHEALLLVACGLAPLVGRYGLEVSDRDRRDVQAMLRHLLDAHKRSLGQLTPANVSPSSRSLAHEVRKLRNELFHGAEFDLEKEIRLLSSCWRLLEEIDARESVGARRLVDRWIEQRRGNAPSGPGAWTIDTSNESPTRLRSDEVPATAEQERLASVDRGDDWTDQEGVGTVMGAGDPVEDSDLQEVIAGTLLPVSEIIRRVYDAPVRAWGQMRDALWVYQGESTVECPQCGTLLDVCRKGRYEGYPDERPWAVVCVPCGTAMRKQEYPPDLRARLWRWGHDQLVSGGEE